MAVPASYKPSESDPAAVDFAHAGLQVIALEALGLAGSGVLGWVSIALLPAISRLCIAQRTVAYLAHLHAVFAGLHGSSTVDWTAPSLLILAKAAQRLQQSCLQR